MSQETGVLVTGVVAYASQMLTNSTPETSPSFADVDKGTSAAGYTVHKIFRRAGEMIADGEGAFRASYSVKFFRFFRLTSAPEQKLT